MRVLVTGHSGYIGSVMVETLRRAGHEVAGLDTFFFRDCTFGSTPREIPSVRADIRDVDARHLAGFDAVIHLAALCNDPLGSMNPGLTYEINHRASVRLAELAKAAGVTRYLFASSCSLYGVAGDDMLQEDADFSPITPYGESKVLVERDVARLADDDFTPTFMRNATAFGVSPRLRLDVVINNLVAVAHATGEVLIQSDGTPWRPLVHAEDFSRAFLAALEAPRELVHNEAFNVGRTSENYRVSELAEMVGEVVPGSRIRYAEEGSPDPRSYRVDCSKLESTLPGYDPQWTVRKGIEQLYAAFREFGMSEEDFNGPDYFRIRHIKRLQEQRRIDGAMRWQDAVDEMDAGELAMVPTAANS
ncbi:MAG: NAD-dependent epimerase/dehydratase family protein [Gemmatimonas sp.]|nr:NAD-dependent epimerase/dehydratase family protein [Gemmatimonas sp.]